jgi:hypothetical protein
MLRIEEVLTRCAAAAGILLGAILANSNAEAAGPFGSINVGNWKGGAYTFTLLISCKAEKKESAKN